MIDSDARALVMYNMNEYESPTMPKCAACRALSSAKGGRLYENWINHFTAKEKSAGKKNSKKRKVVKNQQSANPYQ